jgi:F-type H+-transporting ATPase subunit epsilon
MASKFVCKIVTPEEMLYDGQVELISTPGVAGDYGFMRCAAPYVSVLRMGKVGIHEEEHDAGKQYAVLNGYVEADGQKVVVLASQAIDVSTIDKEVCNARLADYKEKLSAIKEDDPQAVYYQTQTKWQDYLLSLVAPSA